MGCMGTYAAAGCWVPFSTGLEGHDHEAELESLVAWNTARQKHTRRSPEQTPDPHFFFVTCPGCERKSAVSRRGRVSHGTSFLRPWLFSTAEARTSNSSSSSSSSCLAMRPPRKVRPFCFFNYWSRSRSARPHVYPTANCAKWRFGEKYFKILMYLELALLEGFTRGQELEVFRHSLARGGAAAIEIRRRTEPSTGGVPGGCYGPLLT